MKGPNRKLSACPHDRAGEWGAPRANKKKLAELSLGQSDLIKLDANQGVAPGQPVPAVMQV